MTNKDLKALLKLLRSEGVLIYKTKGIELQLTPGFEETKASPKFTQATDEVLKGLAGTKLPILTEEEWLLGTNGSFEGIENG